MTKRNEDSLIKRKRIVLQTAKHDSVPTSKPQDIRDLLAETSVTLKAMSRLILKLHERINRLEHPRRLTPQDIANMMNAKSI